ncbi:hypothetical protein [Enterococcus sp. LJL90]
MKNELTAAEWLALAEALEYLDESIFNIMQNDLEPYLENAVEKVKDTANKIKERNK